MAEAKKLVIEVAACNVKKLDLKVRRQDPTIYPLCCCCTDGWVCLTSCFECNWLNMYVHYSSSTGRGARPGHMLLKAPMGGHQPNQPPQQPLHGYCYVFA
jgi:hypothetical protein